MSIRRRLATQLIPLLIISSTPASAHDWYPWDCCSGMDCAPVERTELMPNADMRVTSKHGTAVVPATFPKRDSLDNKMHICMRPGENGMKTICIFLPPAS